MREKELQDFVEHLVAGERLLDNIGGWDEVRDIALDRLQSGERLLLLDNLVLHRAADAALLVRDRLVDLTPVSNDNRSISLDRSERLFADLLYISPATGTVVVFEIKRARATARETVTELLAYEQELRNHLPFAARTDICFVVVSTDYAPLLDHSLSSLIAWHGLKALCLEADETGQMTVRLPKGWTSLGQDVIPSQHIATTSLTFVPHDLEGDPVQVGILVNSALDMIAREADYSGITGFGFAWENIQYPLKSRRPAGLTVARVNPTGFLSSAKVDYFLDTGQRSPLHQYITEYSQNGRWRPSFPELDSATRFLSRHGTVKWHHTPKWQDLRGDHRHRSADTIMDRYAVPIVFNSWGLVGDYTRNLLSNPTRLADTTGEFGDQVIETRNPEFVLKVVDTIAPDDKIPVYGARWLSRLGFRLARLWTYAKAYRVKTDFLVRDRLRPLLAWARADLAVPLTELYVATSLAEVTERPPQLTIGHGRNGEPYEEPDAIRLLVRWIADHLIGDRSKLHRTVFEAAFQNAQALDEALPGIAPHLDLSEITAQTIYNARGALDIAIRLAPERPGAHAGLVAHLADSFGIACDADIDSDELTVAVREIPTELLLNEYTRAVPAALDIAIPTLHFARRTAFPTLPAGTTAVLRRRICEHRAAGRHPGIYFDASGGYGIVMLDDVTVAVFGNLTDDEVIVRTSSPGGSEHHHLTTWERLAK